MSKNKKILVINFGGIGDEILFSPVLNSIKKTFPDCKLTLCLEERSKAFLYLTSNVDDYFFADIKTKNKYIELVKLLYKAITCGYDIVISAGGNPLLSILLYMTGIKRRIGFKTGSISEKLLTDAVPLKKDVYASEMYFELVKPLTAAEFELPKINIPGSEKEPDTVLVHPGVSIISVNKGIQKTLCAEKWAEIIEKLLQKGKKVILAGGPDDTKCIETIRKCLRGKNTENLTDMFGKTKNITDLAKLINASEVLLCSDSAPMHIGVSLNCKTVAIFGPTDENKLLPKNDKKYIAVKNDEPCRPCLWAKRQTTCVELKCLDIDTDKIVDTVINI